MKSVCTQTDVEKVTIGTQCTGQVYSSIKAVAESEIESESEVDDQSYNKDNTSNDPLWEPESDTR